MGKKKIIIIYSDEALETNSHNTSEIAFEEIKWRLRIEKKGRGGKTVTIVDDNMESTEKQINHLARVLKQHCGVGGSVKEEGIILQGDVRKKALAYLISIGCKDVK